jgi:hypothetical protein
MTKTLSTLVVLVLAAFTAAAPAHSATSACDNGGEGTYACQVERYEKAGF